MAWLKHRNGDNFASHGINENYRQNFRFSIVTWYLFQQSSTNTSNEDDVAPEAAVIYSVVLPASSSSASPSTSVGAPNHSAHPPVSAAPPLLPSVFSVLGGQCLSFHRLAQVEV